MSTIIRRAVVFGLTLNVITFAQTDDTKTTAADLKKIQADLTELKQEIASLKEELKGLRSGLTQAITAIKSAGKAPAPRQRPAMELVGQPAPTQAITTFDGTKGTIGGKRDKPQVLFCYASWCGFCKKSLPWMESLHNKYKDKGVQVLALNLDARGGGGRGRTEEQTTEHYKSLNLTMPMTMTTATNNTATIGAALKAQSFPTLFVLGTTGNVEAVHVGAVPGLDGIVGKELDVLLAGKTRADFPK